MPDLAKRTENSLTEYGVVFVSRAIGNVAGAFLSMLVVNSRVRQAMGLVGCFFAPLLVAFLLALLFGF